MVVNGTQDTGKSRGSAEIRSDVKSRAVKLRPVDDQLADGRGLSRAADRSWIPCSISFSFSPPPPPVSRPPHPLVTGSLPSSLLASSPGHARFSFFLSPRGTSSPSPYARRPSPNLAAVSFSNHPLYLRDIVKRARATVGRGKPRGRKTRKLRVGKMGRIIECKRIEHATEAHSRELCTMIDASHRTRLLRESRLKERKTRRRIERGSEIDGKLVTRGEGARRGAGFKPNRRGSAYDTSSRIAAPARSLEVAATDVAAVKPCFYFSLKPLDVALSNGSRTRQPFHKMADSCSSS